MKKKSLMIKEHTPTKQDLEKIEKIIDLLAEIPQMHTRDKDFALEEIEEQLEGLDLVLSDIRERMKSWIWCNP